MLRRVFRKEFSYLSLRRLLCCQRNRQFSSNTLNDFVTLRCTAKLYAASYTSESLKSLFSKYGTVKRCEIDRKTIGPDLFEITIDAQGAQQAMEALRSNFKFEDSHTSPKPQLSFIPKQHNTPWNHYTFYLTRRILSQFLLNGFSHQLLGHLDFNNHIFIKYGIYNNYDDIIRWNPMMRTIYSTARRLLPSYRDTYDKSFQPQKSRNPYPTQTQNSFVKAVHGTKSGVESDGEGGPFKGKGYPFEPNTLMFMPFVEENNIIYAKDKDLQHRLGIFYNNYIPREAKTLPGTESDKDDKHLTKYCEEEFKVLEAVHLPENLYPLPIYASWANVNPPTCMAMAQLYELLNSNLFHTFLKIIGFTYTEHQCVYSREQCMVYVVGTFEVISELEIPSFLRMLTRFLSHILFLLESRLSISMVDDKEGSIMLIKIHISETPVKADGPFLMFRELNDTEYGDPRILSVPLSHFKKPIQYETNKEMIVDATELNRLKEYISNTHRVHLWERKFSQLNDIYIKKEIY